MAGLAVAALPGCSISATTTFPGSGILEDPARPSVAGWAVTASWGGDVNGGLCLEAARMYVHDTSHALRTWEVIADGAIVESAVFAPGPGYHYWTFPARKLGRVSTLCVGVTVPESRDILARWPTGHASASAG